MAFSIAVRAKPRGAARPCSHSCSVRFEICNFKAASLCERFIPLTPGSQSSWKRTSREPLMSKVMGKRPEAHFKCYTGITYSIKSTGQADRLLQLIHALGLSIALVRIGSCFLDRVSDCRLQTLDFKFVAFEVFTVRERRERRRNVTLLRFTFPSRIRRLRFELAPVAN